MAARCLFLALLVAMGADAAAINRCVALDGVLVYTDQTCESLGIAERVAGPMPRRRVGSASGAARDRQQRDAQHREFQARSQCRLSVVGWLIDCAGRTGFL